MQQSDSTVNRYRISSGQSLLQDDLIAIEEPLQISLFDQQQETVYSITLRTPGHDIELVTGLLFSEGIISRASEIEGIEMEKVDNTLCDNLISIKLSSELISRVKFDRRHPSYSGCGFCGKTSIQALELKQTKPIIPLQSKLTLPIVSSMIDKLTKQPLFSSTGGSHTVGLVYEIKGHFKLDDSSPFFEDIGRHNALDKLIGHELKKNNLEQPGVLLLSGRIGFELVQKAAMAGFSTIIALGAPSSLAIQTAKQFAIILIGFAKHDHFNLYTANLDAIESSLAEQ